MRVGSTRVLLRILPPLVAIVASCASERAPDAGGGPADVAAASDVAPDVDAAAPDTGTGTADIGDPGRRPEEPVAPPDGDQDGLSDEEEALLGTCPAAPDTDGDGILDGAEVGDGTDPLDPRSAVAWHPEVKGHPRLFFGPEDVPGLESRAAAVGEGAGDPPAVLWKRIVQRASSEPTAWPADGWDPGIARERAFVASAAAFVGLVTGDLALAEKAAKLLADPAPDLDVLLLSDPQATKYDLTEAEALVNLCSAWDYLAPLPLEPATKQEAKSGVLARLHAFRTVHFEPTGYQLYLLLAMNNHNMKTLGALGLCAMALPDRPEAAEEFNEAISGLDFLLNHFQGNPEGGYAEGWGYLSYGGQTFLPFLLAVHRWLDGGSVRARGLGLLTVEDPDAGKVREYQDFAVHTTTKEIYRKALLSTRPDGLTVPTDDSDPTALDGLLLASLFDDGRFLHNWLEPAAGLRSGHLPSLCFAAYDPKMAPLPLEPPLDGAFPSAGFAVLRSETGPQSLFVYLLAENGPMRLHGGGHEQADPLSFLIHAHGEPLIIDPGYISWTQHALVKYGTDHNLVLVDGKGPSFPVDGPIEGPAGDDAFIEGFADDGLLTSVLARSEYLGVTVRRRLVRMDHEYVVVADAVAAQDGAPHEYTFLLNGLGGGDVPDGSFELLPAGARWSRPAALVEAVVGTTEGETSYGHRLEEHATSFGKYGLHEVLEAGAQMQGAAGFLAAIVPAAAGATPAAVTLTGSEPGVVRIDVDTGDALDSWVLNRTGDDVSLGDWTGPVPPGLTVRRAVGSTVEERNLPF